MPHHHSSPFPLSPALPLTPYAPAMRRVGDGCLARFESQPVSRFSDQDSSARLRRVSRPGLASSRSCHLEQASGSNRGSPESRYEDLKYLHLSFVLSFHTIFCAMLRSTFNAQYTRMRETRTAIYFHLSHLLINGLAPYPQPGSNDLIKA